MKILTAAALVFAVSSTAAAPAAAQDPPPLAPLAKKLEAQKGAKPEPGKTYTNKNTRPAPTVPATAAPAASGATTAEAKPVVSDVKDEAYWGNRMRALRSAYNDAGAQLGSGIRMYEVAKASLEANSRGAHSIVAHRALLDATAEMTRLTALVENAKRAIGEFEEEARRAGVPPGWLRVQ